MLFIKRLTASSQPGWKIFQHLLLPLFLDLALLLFQTPALALQIESVAMRNMGAYKKFAGLSQNAVVIKTRATQNKYIDQVEFSSGELANDEDTSFLVSVGPTWISNSKFGNELMGGHLFFPRISSLACTLAINAN